MRLAEEEKLRKEMSAKKAKEEAERKHQVSREPPGASSGCSCHPRLAAHVTRHRSLPSTLQSGCTRPTRPALPELSLGTWSCAMQKDRGLWWLQRKRPRPSAAPF